MNLCVPTVKSVSMDMPGWLQVDQLDLLADYVDAGNYARTCLYLTSTSAYLPEPDDHLVLVKVRRQKLFLYACLLVNVQHANRIAPIMAPLLWRVMRCAELDTKSIPCNHGSEPSVA